MSIQDELARCAREQTEAGEELRNGSGDKALAWLWAADWVGEETLIRLEMKQR